MPFEDSAAGCGGFIDRVAVAPRRCPAEPVLVGLHMYRERAGRRYVVLGFASDRHADYFDAHRPIEDRDRALLERRRGRERVELAGRVWDGEDEEPLAWGRKPTSWSSGPGHGWGSEAGGTRRRQPAGWATLRPALQRGSVRPASLTFREVTQRCTCTSCRG